MCTSVFFVSKFVAVLHFCQIYLVCTIPEKQKSVSARRFLQLKMFAKNIIVWFNDTYIYF